MQLELGHYAQLHMLFEVLTRRPEKGRSALDAALSAAWKNLPGSRALFEVLKEIEYLKHWHSSYYRVAHRLLQSGKSHCNDAGRILLNYLESAEVGPFGRRKLQVF